MDYKCLKIGQDISSCPQRIEDVHCYYCPLYQDDSPYIKPPEETTIKALQTILDAVNVALKSVDEIKPYMVMGIEREEEDQ